MTPGLCACGLRSVAWFDNLSEAMQIVISEVHTELHSKAPNPAQFEAYANTLMKWLYLAAAADRTDYPRELRGGS